ncbi:MAG: Na/Pi symporter [Pseudomonadota bacterium]
MAGTKKTFELVWTALPAWIRSVLTVSAFLLALDLFFVAISLLGAFKSLGSGLGHDLIVELAANPILGLVVGILVTSVVQSSSSTTSLVVGLVAAGTLGDDPVHAVRVAVPIVMGANIGTSVTNILVSFGHVGDRREFERAFAAATVHDFFNVLSVIVLLPLQIATNFLGRLSMAAVDLFSRAGGLSFASPLKLLVKPQQHLVSSILDNHWAAAWIVCTTLAGLVLVALQHVLKRALLGQPARLQQLGLVLALGSLAMVIAEVPGLLHSSELATLLVALIGLFTALWAMVRVMRGVVLGRIERLFHNYIFKTPVRAMVLGLLFTALVQSSSVTTSLIVPIAGAGLLTLEQIYPYTLGANVGTTVTAMLAALSLGQPAAVAVAAAHLFFNLLGIAIFYPLRRLPIFLARRLAALSVVFPPTAPLFVAVVFFIVPIVLIAIVR